MNGRNHKKSNFTPAMMNGQALSGPQKFMRDTDATPTILSIEVWPDGSAKAKVDGTELVQFTKLCKGYSGGVERIVRMLREAAVIIESGII